MQGRNAFLRFGELLDILSVGFIFLFLFGFAFIVERIVSSVPQIVFQVQRYFNCYLIDCAKSKRHYPLRIRELVFQLGQSNLISCIRFQNSLISSGIIDQPNPNLENQIKVLLIALTPSYTTAPRLCKFYLGTSMLHTG